MILRRQLSQLKLLLPIAIVACLAGSATAQPDTETEHAELTRQLEEARQRVRQLEEKLRQVEQGRTQPAPVSKLAEGKAAFPMEAECTNPFVLGRDGVKRMRPECITSGSAVSCDASPFILGDDGIKHVRLDCRF